ncbi:MAG: spherulation-specific family 4 protein [Candidatus Micrarchaeia archaeon]
MASFSSYLPIIYLIAIAFLGIFAATAPSNSTSTNSVQANTIVFNSVAQNASLQSNIAITFMTVPNNQQILFANSIYYSGNSISIAPGNYPIDAIATGNFVFSSWLSSNANASFLNQASQNTTVSLSGNSIITASFNALTTFSENGLPANAVWSIIYNGIYQNATAPNKLLFYTPPGTYGFLVNPVILGNNTYIPNPASGNIFAGNAMIVNFALQGLITNASSAMQNATSNLTSTNPLLGINVTVNGYIQGNLINELVEEFRNIRSAIPHSKSQINQNIEIKKVLGSFSSNESFRVNIIILSGKYNSNKVYIANISITSSFSNNRTFSRVNFIRPNMTIPILYYPKSQLSQISIEPKISMNNVSTSVSTLDFIPNNYPRFGLPFYSLFQIDSSLNDSFVKSAVYNFSVSKAWVSNLGISPGQVTLYKYISLNNTWVPLPTTYTGTNGTYYFYTAVSNSLSTYAVGFSVNGITSTASSASLTLPLGYANYFYALGISPYLKNAYPPKPSTNWVNDSTATYSYRSGSSDYTNLASIGHSNSNTGSYSTTGTVSGASLVGVGANVLVQNGAVFRANTGVSSATSLSLSYSVATSNSFAIIMFSSAWYNFTSAPTTTASGCVLQKYLSYGGYASAAELVCNSIAAGSYTASVSTTQGSAISAAAYVFPPYNVILNDNPTTATITTNGATYSNGQVMQVIGTNTITANPPTTGNWVFNSWSVSNSINLSISSYTANPATLTVMGSGTVTATWNGITKFFETGLPSGTYWSVTYDGVSKTALAPNSINFSTSAGSYAFSVQSSTYGANCSVYNPNVTSGTLSAGSTQTVSFSISKSNKNANITMPSGIIGYVPITLINGQSSATPAPFQQMVSIDSNVFKPLENKNITNVEFFYANGTIIPSWLESGNSNTSNYTVYWLKLSNSIPANSALTVYMGFAPHSVNYMGCKYVGEAPELSPIYGEYDNGANVFNYYTNFQGTSLPSGWVMGGSYTVNNGLFINTGSGVFDYYNSPFATPYAVDAYESGNSLANSEVTDLMSSTTSLSTYVELYLDSSLNWVLQSSSSSAYNGTGSLNSYYVHTLEGGSTVLAYENYSYVTSESSTPMQQYIGFFTGTSSGDLYSIKWIRVRAYPPNGIMPYQIIGNAFSPYLHLQSNQINYGTSDNIFTESNPIIDKLNLLINGNVVASNTMLINYTIPSTEPAGTYNITSIDTNSTTFMISQNDTLRILVPAYFYNGILWQEVAKLDWKGIAIANPNNGPGTSTDPNYQSWINNVTKNGGMVLGYVYTDYGHRPLSAVEGNISEWYTLYPAISGIFLDQYNSSSNINATYYGDIYTYIKTKYPSNSFIMANPGIIMPVQAMQKVGNYANVFNIFEGTYQNFKSFSLPNYLQRYGSKKFSAIVINVSQSNLQSAETIANESGLSYAYFTNNNSATNPYATLPSYFSIFTNNTTNTLHTTQTLIIKSSTCTISLTPTFISFGNLNPGNSIATIYRVNDTNTGNANAYMVVYGGNWIGPVQFGVSNTTWSKESGTLFSFANKLSLTAVNTTILVPAGSSNTIYFGVGVPGGAPAGAYTQDIIIENSC